VVTGEKIGLAIGGENPKKSQDIEGHGAQTVSAGTKKKSNTKQSVKKAIGDKGKSVFESLVEVKK